MSRIVLHSDANSFYANVECLFRPELADKPVAVAGDPEARHGIILTKNQLAKQYGVLTAEPIHAALDKCPQLILVRPNYALYLEFAEKLKALYGEYSDYVEPFGLDEAWLDVTKLAGSLEDGMQIAQEIRQRAKGEIGLTVSIGVSFNKVYAKLGSDLKKPDAVTLISPANYQQLVWPLPASSLLFVGRQTTAKLKSFGIETIGDLAQTDEALLKMRLGKNGTMIQAYAQGRDDSPVLSKAEAPPIKSIGNSTTPPHDIRDLEDAKCILFILAESIAAQLRAKRLRTACISLQVRTSELALYSCQCALQNATALTSVIAKAAIQLFSSHYLPLAPFRGVGVQCSALRSEFEPVQLAMFEDAVKDEKALRLEHAIDGLRTRYGAQAIQRGVVLGDQAYARVHPNEHIQPAAPFYRG